MYVVVAAPEQSKQLSVSWAEGAWHGHGTAKRAFSTGCGTMHASSAASA